EWVSSHGANGSLDRGNVLFGHRGGIVTPGRANISQDGGEVSERELALPRWHKIAATLDRRDDAVRICSSHTLIAGKRGNRLTEALAVSLVAARAPRSKNRSANRRKDGRPGGGNLLLGD